MGVVRVYRSILKVCSPCWRIWPLACRSGVNYKEYASADSTWIYSVLSVHARKKPGILRLQSDDNWSEKPGINGEAKYDLYGHMHRIGYVHFGHY